MLRRSTLVSGALLSVSLCAGAAERRPMNVEDVLALESVADPRVSPDGRWVAYVVTTMDFAENQNDSNIWVVATESEDAAPRQLTSYVGRDDAPRWAPDSTWLIFSSDRSDSRQLFGIRPDGGEAWPVTDWHRAIESFRTSPDGTMLGFVSKPETSDALQAFEKERGRPVVWGEPFQDEWSYLWLAPIEDRRAGEARRVSADGVFVSRFVFSPDSSSLAFDGRPSPALRTRADTDVFVVPATGGPARQLTDMSGGESPVAWTESLGIVIAGSGEALGTFNRKLWTVPPEGGEPTLISGALDENASFVAAAGDDVYVERARRTGRGLSRLGAVSADITGAGYASGFSMSRDASVLAYVYEAGDAPPNVYFSRTDALQPRRLTRHNGDVGEVFLFGEQRVESWKSRADGELIEGVLNLPPGYRDGDSVPLLLVIHGGPSGVSSDRFSPRRGAYPVQVFAGMGYAVLQPNYRGSTGYGERFRGLNRGDISGRDWVDIDSGVDALVERGIADPERLGIMGWSFGGHHTFWGITQTERFKAASAGAGANDLISMYSQTDLPEFYHTYLGPKPWEDFTLYEERSAYRFVDNVTTPLLIQVGERDERVPAEQSIQFYEAVRAIGKAPTTLVVYPGQPHGVREPRLVRDLLLRNVEWFSRWVPVAGRASDAGS